MEDRAEPTRGGHLPGRRVDGAMSGPRVAAVRRLGRADRGRARSRRGLGRGEPRRRDQGDPGRRARHAPRPVPADRRRPRVAVGGPLHAAAPVRGLALNTAGGRRTSPRRAGDEAPDAVQSPAAGGACGRRSARARPVAPKGRTHVPSSTPTTRPSGSSPAPSARPGSGRSSSRPATEPGSPASPGEAAGVRPRRADRRAARRGHAHRGGEATIPAVAPVGLEDTDPLEQPIVEEFRAGTMTLSWDADDERIVIEVFPSPRRPSPSTTSREDEDRRARARGGPRGRIPAGLARAFASAPRRGLRRPAPCPFCGGPIDPAGHLCPRANGFRRYHR